MTNISPWAAGARAQGFRHGVGGFKRGNDSFRAGQYARGVERLLIGDRAILGALVIVQPGMFGAHQRVIQAGRYRMRQRHLPIGVLQKITMRAVQHARRSTREARRMRTQRYASPARLHSNQAYALVA